VHRPWRLPYRNHFGCTAMRWIQGAWTHDSLYGDGSQHYRLPECSTLEHDHRPSKATESTALLPVPVDRQEAEQQSGRRVG
jgi:hypothetical protein